ncbi:MFS transporter [Bacillus gaemokensis]|uniref:MFS transporter n=1 Tax=Bacillus gaemokensis TaxID=574375 RepID=A0A073K5W6_9BACI|nr:MFS transporter [Bacillus gaemokensis]KEK22694.1 MFS transporter [Bacillus gaemokensis]KYG28882.1 MFS transporter [Bacillus gaemokensis]
MLNQEEIMKYDSSYRWIVLMLATVTQASATLITYGVGPLAFFWKEIYNLTNMQMGMLLTTVNIGPLFCMLFVGRLLDQYNERLLIGVSSILLGGSILFINIVEGFTGLLFVLALVGVFYSTAQPGGSKVILKWFPKGNRGLAMGIRQAGIPIGGAVAGAIVPMISLKFSVSCTIYILSSICIAGGVLFLVFYREPFAHKESIPNNKLISFWQQLKEVMHNKELYPVFFTGICMISLQMVLIGHFIKFLITAKSIPPILAGQIFSVTLLSGMIGRIVLATVSDFFYKGNRRKPLCISVLATCTLIFILMLNIHNLSVGELFLFSSFLGFFGIGWFSLFMVEIAEKSREDLVGITVSFALTLNQIAIILAPPIFGFIVDIKGYSWAWMGMTILLFVSVISLLENFKKMSCK